MLIVGLIASISLGLFVSNSLHKTISSQLRQASIENIFVSIETGPLVLAKLHASTISNDFLNQLMNQTRKEHSLFLGAQISGGLNNEFIYANWVEKKLDHACSKTFSKNYDFKDALHAFTLSITVDDCYEMPLEKKLKSITYISFFIMILVVFFLLLIVSIPLARSMQLAIKAIQKTEINENQILYLPLRKLVLMAKKSVQLEREIAYSKLAIQVAHDIRSPLSALNVVANNLQQIPQESKNLIRLAIQRINNIANDLLKNIKTKSLTQPSMRHLHFKSIIDAIILEKRIEFKEFSDVSLVSKLKPNFDDQGYADPVEIERILSNLINNSVESFELKKGIVNIDLQSESSRICIIISDNGPGIPPEILKKLNEGELGVSYGKQNANSGTGLGVYYAKTKTEAMNGHFTIDSKLGIGTTIHLCFPKALDISSING